MRRRKALLGMAAIITGLSGCNEDQSNSTNTVTSQLSDSPVPSATESSTETTIHSETATETPSASETTTETSSAKPTDQQTPPPEFRQRWLLDRDNDWMERRKVTEYPETDDAYNWRPNYAYTTEYVHVPSQENLGSVLGGVNAPPLACAVVSKWALPSDYSNSSVGLVHQGRQWFKERFTNCPVTVISPQVVEPSQSELESGQIFGKDRYEVEGDTGQLESSFQTTINDDSVTVERITYNAKGLLLGLLGTDDKIGYFAGGGWPIADTITLYTADNGTVEVSAPVSGKSWHIENQLKEVLATIVKE